MADSKQQAVVLKKVLGRVRRFWPGLLGSVILAFA